MLTSMGLVGRATWTFIALVVSMGLLIAVTMTASFFQEIKDEVTQALQARADSTAAWMEDDNARLLEDADYLSRTLQVAGLNRAVSAGGTDPLTHFSAEQWQSYLATSLREVERSKSSYVAARILNAPTIGGIGMIGDRATDTVGLRLDEMLADVQQDRERFDAMNRPYLGLHRQSGEWFAVAVVGLHQPGEGATKASILVVEQVSPQFRQLESLAASTGKLTLSWRGEPLGAGPEPRLSRLARDVSGHAEVGFDNGSVGIFAQPTVVESGIANSFLLGLAAVAGVLVVGIFIASWFIRRLTAPVVEITRAVDSFSRGGAVSHLDSSGWAEIGHLAGAINRCMTMFVEQTTAIGESHQALERRENYLRTIQESAPVGIICVKPDGQVQDANSLAQQMLGFSAEDVRILDALQQATGTAYRDVPKIDGVTLALDSGRQIAVSVGSHLTDDGLSYVMILADITDLSEAEANARKNEAFLDAIIENLPLMLAIKDAETLEFVRINRHGEELLGVGRQEVIGRDDVELLGAEQGQAMIDDDRAVLGSGYARDIPEEFITNRRGEVRWLHTRKSIISDRDSGARFLLRLSEDITEFRNRFLEHQRNEALLGAVFENAPFPMLLRAAGDLRVLRANSAAEDLFGKTREQLVGNGTADVSQDYERRLRAFCDADELHTTFEQSQELDGGRILEVHAAKILDDEGAATNVLTIVDDVTERRSVHARMEDARLAAERANQAKSAFLAAMSHEIRTPMNGVLGTLDLLARSPLAPDQAKLSDIARDSARTLLRVIEDVLDFSKIESDKIAIESEPFHLDKAVESVVAALWQEAAAQKVQLSCVVDASVPTSVRGDQVRVRQILYNLVGNAIKFRDVEKGTSYTRVGCERTVEQGSDGCMRIRFFVEDNGIGIHPDRLESVFEAFEQEEVSTTRRFGGTGLGLAISKRLVDLMGGTIEVSSEQKQGTRFEITLPFEEVAGPSGKVSLEGVQAFLDVEFDVADQVYRYLASNQVEVHPASSLDDEHADVEQPIVIFEDRRGYEARMQDIGARHADARFVVLARRTSCNDVDGSVSVCLQCRPLGRASLLEAMAVAAGRESPYQEAQPVPILDDREREAMDAAGQEGAGRLVLVAEDNEANQTVIEHQLSSLGFACRIANNGRKALELFQRHAFACVLADCHMPEMDGYGLTAAIRDLDDRYAASVPIIAFTANALKGETERCLRSGMDDYLSKPVSMDDLGIKLRHWVDTVQGRQFERSILAEVVGDDPAIQLRVVGRVMESLFRTLDEIAAAGDDQGELRRIAHRLKSSARSVGLPKLGDACEELEEAASTDGSADRIRSVVRRVLRLGAASEVELRAEFEPEADREAG